jgi:hypothetical protein
VRRDRRRNAVARFRDMPSIPDAVVVNVFLDGLRFLRSKKGLPFAQCMVSDFLCENLLDWHPSRTSFSTFNGICEYMGKLGIIEIVHGLKRHSSPRIVAINLNGNEWNSDGGRGDRGRAEGGGREEPRRGCRERPSFSSADGRACDLFIGALKCMAESRGGPRLPFPARFIACEMELADSSWDISSTSWGRFDRLILHMQAIGHVTVSENYDSLIVTGSNHFLHGGSNEKRKRPRGLSLSPSGRAGRKRVDTGSAKAMVVDALEKATLSTCLPFQLSLLSDHVRKANRGWRVSDTGHSSFRSLAEELVAQGYMQMERRDAQVMVTESKFVRNNNMIASAPKPNDSCDDAHDDRSYEYAERRGLPGVVGYDTQGSTKYGLDDRNSRRLTCDDGADCSRSEIAAAMVTANPIPGSLLTRAVTVGGIEATEDVKVSDVGGSTNAGMTADSDDLHIEAACVVADIAGISESAPSDAIATTEVTAVGDMTETSAQVSGDIPASSLLVGNSAP